MALGYRHPIPPEATVPLMPLLFAVLAAAPCAPVEGWNAGRAGKPVSARCSSADYAEAHKLGAALFALVDERTKLEASLASLDAAAEGRQRRRQRQLDNDIEALRGVAVTRGWPYEGGPKPEDVK